MDIFSKFIKKYLFFIGLFLFIFIISKINFFELFANFKKIDLKFLIFALLMSFPLFFFKSLCWNYLKKRQGINYSLKNSILMNGAGLYFGIITPGRSGEIIRALYLKKDGHSIGKSLVSLFLDRLSDLIFLLIFTVIGLAIYLSVFHEKIIYSLILIIITTISIFFIIKTPVLKFFGKKLFYLLVPSKLQNSWKINIQEFINDLKIYNSKNYLIIFLLTACSWTAYYIQMFILTKGLNINVNFLYLAIVVTITGLITILPISISGIGTRDAALILLFTPLSIPLEKIITFSALILALSLWMAVIGFFCWLIKPIKF